MARFITCTATLLSLALLAGCGKPTGTVVKSTVNLTGCPAANLAAFNYKKSAGTWEAVCGDKLFACSSNRGTERCTQQTPQSVDPELMARSQLLLQVPPSRREFFIRTNIMDGEWKEFARNVAVVSALNDQQLKHVDDPRAVFSGFSVAFNQQLVQCVGPNKVAEVSVEADGAITAYRGAARCIGSLVSSVDLAPLKQYVGTTFVLAPNVRDLKIAEHPGAGGVVPTDAEAQEAKRLAEEQAKLKAEQELEAARLNAIYTWLDESLKGLTTCTGLKEIPLDVVIDDQGVATVTPQGKLNTVNKTKCIQAALGQRTFEGGPRALSYVVGAPKLDPAAAPAAPGTAPATAATPLAPMAPTPAPAPAPAPTAVAPPAPAPVAPAPAAPTPAPMAPAPVAPAQ